MRIVTKTALNTILLLLITTSIIAAVVVMSIKSNQSKTLQSYRNIEYTRVEWPNLLQKNMKTTRAWTRTVCVN